MTLLWTYIILWLVSFVILLKFEKEFAQKVTYFLDPGFYAIFCAVASLFLLGVIFGAEWLIRTIFKIKN